MKKLKVALVMPTHFNIHSSLNNLLKVYRHLIKQGKVEVTIFTDKKNNPSYKDFKIQKISGIDYKTPLEKALFLLGIPRFYYSDLVEKLKGYDVIETSNPEFYAFAYESYKAAKKYKSKLIYRTSQTVEGFYLFKVSKFLVVPFARKAYARANALFFTNPQAQQRALDLGLILDTKKAIVIGHATDTKTFRPLKVKKNKTIILSVGGLYKIKGHHLIIEAARKLMNHGHKLEVHIVGEGYCKSELQSLVKKLKMEKNVKFLGALDHNSLTKAYNSASVFALANYQEITPAVNEAMACEVPVVVMECGGRSFVIPDDRYGLVSKKFDTDDMAKKIEFVLNNKEKAEKMAKAGRKRILERFAIEKVAGIFYRVFSK